MYFIRGDTCIVLMTTLLGITSKLKEMYNVIPVSYQLALGLNLTSMVLQLMDSYLLLVS